jgi:outer membrane protein assembly factor BamA
MLVNACLWSCFLSGWGAGRLKAAESVYVQQVVIVGNKKTREAVILREMSFHVGDSIPKDRLDKIIERNQQNIFNLELFNRVEIQSEVVDDRLYVIIAVAERWYIFPIPQFDIEERNTYDFFQNPNLHRLVYGMNLEWRNISGRNEQLDFYGQLGFSQRLHIDYVQPAIFPKQNIDFLLSLRYIREPEIIFGTRDAKVQWGITNREPLRRTHLLKLGLRKRFNARKSLYVELGYHHYHLADSIYDYNIDFLTNGDGREYYPSLVVTYSNDQRDYKGYPLKGFKYQLLFRQTGGPASLASTGFTKLGFTWAQHLPISPRWNFSYGAHFITSIGRYQPFFEKNFIGLRREEFAGTGHNLRGYESYVIDGTLVNMNKAELKFALLPLQSIRIPEIPFINFQEFPLGVYLTAFTDMGYVTDDTFSNQDDFLKNQALLGYGVGLNVIGFYDNLLRVEYSRNHLNQGGIYIHGTVSIK